LVSWNFHFPLFISYLQKKGGINLIVTRESFKKYVAPECDLLFKMKLKFAFFSQSVLLLSVVQDVQQASKQAKSIVIYYRRPRNRFVFWAAACAYCGIDSARESRFPK